jgi:hypothetical protein
MDAISVIEAELEQALCSCPIAARGVWCTMRFVMEHKSDRPGYLRAFGRPLTLVQLSSMTGCDDGALAPCLQALSQSGLTQTDAGGEIYSPILQHIIQRRAERERRTDQVRESDRRRAKAYRDRRKDRPPSNKAPPSRDESRDRHVTARATQVNLPLTLPLEEKKEIAAQSVPANAGKTKPAAKRKSKRTRPPDEHACWKKFIDVWCNVIWPGVFEGKFTTWQRIIETTGEPQLPRVWGILDHVGMDFDKAIGAAKSFAQTFRDSAWRFPCPLNMLRRDMLKWVNHAKLFGENHVNRNRSITGAGSADAFAMPILGARSAAG